MDVELSRAEMELQSEEAALHAELNRLAQVSTELSMRMATLQNHAAQAGEAAIAQRAQTVLPTSILTRRSGRCGRPGKRRCGPDAS